MTATVLVIDDEKNIRRTLRMVLEGEGYEVDEAESAEVGLERVGFGPDLVILDVRLPRMSGLEALTRIRETSPQLPVLMISGHASVAEAVQAVQSGATDFFEKPLDRDRVLVRVKNALEKRALEQEVRRLRADAERRYEMIGESAVMKALYRDIEKVAPTRGRVLITGESGTGKELIARALHRLSPRHDAPFVKVNCAAIPGELIESELFGYERGAFTGAQARRKGMFELADGGTLFLDEIGDMSLNAQAKVLRALQSGEITRVGSEKSIAVDVRVVAATNKDLEKAITDGEFREDLFFRLNVVPLRSPGLRERRDDIPALAAAFLRDFCAENGLKDKPIGPEVLERLQQKAWPGNVRELRNVVERMAILSGDVIEVEDLPADGKLARAAARESGEATPDPIHDEDGRRLTLREYRDRAERRYLVSTLEECEWNVSKAASMLGVERTNLHKKMRSLGVQRDEP
ncbi:MAG TPA: Fis family transcriptional regulator [Myxococcales bacterium]|nr:Fis family transcriptional regulator [Myxococcales bacterium]